ncbi:P-protein [Spathaspora sp. JA1]|nr:P-protein [Spathaspora sp. JA1]
MPLKVAYLGPEGSYTQQAVLQQFGNDIIALPQSTIDDCFKCIDSKTVDYTVVPFENSTNGQVVFTYDLLRDWFINEQPPKFKIVAEQFVAIHHNLLGQVKSLDDIKTIYSHPQVWTQVKKFLSEKIPSNVVRIDVKSTSHAAEMVKNEGKNGTSAAISSKMSSELYELPIMYENIEDNVNNTTRFLVLGYEEPPKQNHEEEQVVTSVMFTLNNAENPGALCDVLVRFKSNDVNLIAINSRPSNVKPWEYVFFVEILGDVKNSLEEIKQNCLELVLLGTFKRSWRYYK